MYVGGPNVNGSDEWSVAEDGVQPVCALACHEAAGDGSKSSALAEVGDRLCEVLDFSLRRFTGNEKSTSSMCPVEFGLCGTD